MSRSKTDNGDNNTSRRHNIIDTLRNARTRVCQVHKMNHQAKSNGDNRDDYAILIGKGTNGRGVCLHDILFDFMVKLGKTIKFALILIIIKA